MAQKVTGWMTDDGQFFETEEGATLHEARRELDEILRSEHKINPIPVIEAIEADPATFLTFAKAVLNAARRGPAPAPQADPSPRPNSSQRPADNARRGKRTVPMVEQ